MFVVDFEALAQASDIQIERDKLSVSAKCKIWTQGLRHQIASRLNARWQSDWALEDQTKKLKLDSPSLGSASIQPTRLQSKENSCDTYR